MKLLWIFLVFLIQPEFGVCYECEFRYDYEYYTCNIGSNLNREERHQDGKTDDDVELVKFEGSLSDHLTKKNFPFCERFKNLEMIEIWFIKSVSGDLFQQCMNLKIILIERSIVKELPENLFSNLKNLTTIRFFRTNLKSLHENIFSNQKNLEWLDLEWNQISCLPPNIFNSLTMLKELNLGTNQIQSLNPKWFENHHSLEKLNLGGNKIQELPKNIFKNLKKLKKLYLWGNQLTTIHSDSFAIPGLLEELDLDYNEISSIDEKILNLENLNKVGIERNICSNEWTVSRYEMKEKLQKCFDNYQHRVDPNLINCGTLVGRVRLIHKGNVTVPNEYPWNAALVTYEGNLFCGGTIVSSKHVVTAAHCIKDKGSVVDSKNECDFYVMLGVYNFTMDWEEGRIGMSIKSIFIHPDWNGVVDYYEADIALLELLNEINFSKQVRPICIPDVDSDVASVTRGTAVGFGVTENGTISDIAQKLQIPIYSYQDCLNRSPDHRYIASSRSFCGGWANGSGVCSGDSGSGVYVIHKSAYYLRGIVSSSLPTPELYCDVNRLAVFTDVPVFYGWIKSGGLDKNASNRKGG